MQQQLITPGTDAEKTFITVRNAYSTAALTVGQVVSWAGNGTNDGIAVTQPTTALLPLVAGVVAQTIAVGGVGLVQIYGLNSDCLVEGGTDVAVGDQLIAQDASFSVVKASATDLHDCNKAFLTAVQAYTTAAAAAKKVFVRC